MSKPHGGLRTPPGGRPRRPHGRIVKAIINEALDAAPCAEAKRQGVSISNIIGQALKSYLKIS